MLQRDDSALEICGSWTRGRSLQVHHCLLNRYDTSTEWRAPKRSSQNHHDTEISMTLFANSMASMPPCATVKP